MIKSSEIWRVYGGLEVVDVALFGAVAIFGFLIQLFVIRLLSKTRFFRDPNDSAKPQRLHDTDVLRAGGLGIFTTSLVVVFLVPSGCAFILAGIVAFLSGILEDFRSALSARQRLFIQLVAALVGVVLLDCVILDVGLPFVLPYIFGVIFTLFAVIGATNSINIIDGCNGLASGIAIMVLCSLAYASISVGDVELSVLALFVCAATLGFFVLNFPKGRIFLGDGGAYFLGFSIVQIAILLAERHEEISAWFALCVMIYPVYEVVFSIYRRKILRVRSPFAPDSLHLHSLLFKRKIKSNPKTALFLLAFNAPFVFVPLFFMNSAMYLIVIIALFITLYNLIYRRIVRFGR